MKEICALLRSGELRVGDRIPDERELARRLRISMAGVQIGIHYLSTLDVLRMEQGVGAFVTEDAEEFVRSEMDLNHDQKSWSVACMREALNVLQGGLAAVAAARGGKFRGRMSEELMEMYVAADSPKDYLIHEMAFHRAVARSAGNPILSSLVAKLTASIYDVCQDGGDNGEDLTRSTDKHRRIYEAIRSQYLLRAGQAMERHLKVPATDQGSRDMKNERVT